MRRAQDRARGPERTERESRDENVPAKRADFFICFFFCLRCHLRRHLRHRI